MDKKKTAKKLSAIILSICFIAQILIPCYAFASEECVRLPVIMYHHIHRDPKRWGEYIVSEETLEGDLKFLKDNGYETVTPSQLIRYVNGESELPEKPVMLTFDDGQESFLVYALPLLEKYGMSAVAAIVGSYADMDSDTVHNVAYSYMSWEQLAQLHKSPHVELQNHTYAMHNLEPRRGCRIMKGETPEHYAEMFSKDLERNEELFIKHFGVTPTAFAYPFGHKCPEALEVLKSRGYQVVFSCEERVNSVSRNSNCLLDLGRFNRPDGISREAFFSRLLT